jgi:hypothetical protein
VIWQLMCPTNKIVKFEEKSLSISSFQDQRGSRGRSWHWNRLYAGKERENLPIRRKLFVCTPFLPYVVCGHGVRLLPGPEPQEGIRDGVKNATRHTRDAEKMADDYRTTERLRSSI